MLSNYVVKLLIFLFLVLFIGQLNNMSIYKFLNILNIKKREGMDECSQNEKDELYKQKMKINDIKDKSSKIKLEIKNLEKEIQRNKVKIGENSSKIKADIDKSKQNKNQAEQQSKDIKY